MSAIALDSTLPLESTFPSTIITQTTTMSAVAIDSTLPLESTLPSKSILSSTVTTQPSTVSAITIESTVHPESPLPSTAISQSATLFTLESTSLPITTSSQSRSTFPVEPKLSTISSTLTDMSAVANVTALPLSSHSVSTGSIESTLPITSPAASQSMLPTLVSSPIIKLSTANEIGSTLASSISNQLNSLSPSTAVEITLTSKSTRTTTGESTRTTTGESTRNTTVESTRTTTGESTRTTAGESTRNTTGKSTRTRTGDSTRTTTGESTRTTAGESTRTTTGEPTRTTNVELTLSSDISSESITMLSTWLSMFSGQNVSLSTVKAKSTLSETQINTLSHITTTLPANSTAFNVMSLASTDHGQNTTVSATMSTVSTMSTGPATMSKVSTVSTVSTMSTLSSTVSSQNVTMSAVTIESTIGSSFITVNNTDYNSMSSPTSSAKTSVAISSVSNSTVDLVSHSVHSTDDTTTGATRSSLSTSHIMLTSSATVIHVFTSFSLLFKISNRNFTAEMADTTSDVYKATAGSITPCIVKALEMTFEERYISLEPITLSNGSIFVSSVFLLTVNDTTDYELQSLMNNLWGILGNSGFLMDNNSFSVRPLLKPTKTPLVDSSQHQVNVVLAATLTSALLVTAVVFIIVVVAVVRLKLKQRQQQQQQRQRQQQADSDDPDISVAIPRPRRLWLGKMSLAGYDPQTVYSLPPGFRQENDDVIGTVDDVTETETETTVQPACIDGRLFPIRGLPRQPNTNTVQPTVGSSSRQPRPSLFNIGFSLTTEENEENMAAEFFCAPAPAETSAAAAASTPRADVNSQHRVSTLGHTASVSWGSNVENQSRENNNSTGWSAVRDRLARLTPLRRRTSASPHNSQRQESNGRSNNSTVNSPAFQTQNDVTEPQSDFGDIFLPAPDYGNIFLPQPDYDSTFLPILLDELNNMSVASGSSLSERSVTDAVLDQLAADSIDTPSNADHSTQRYNRHPVTTPVNGMREVVGNKSRDRRRNLERGYGTLEQMEQGFELEQLGHVETDSQLLDSSNALHRNANHHNSLLNFYARQLATDDETQQQQRHNHLASPSLASQLTNPVVTGVDVTTTATIPSHTAEVTHIEMNPVAPAAAPEEDQSVLTYYKPPSLMSRLQSTLRSTSQHRVAIHRTQRSYCPPTNNIFMPLLRHSNV